MHTILFRNLENADLKNKGTKKKQKMGKISGSQRVQFLLHGSGYPSPKGTKQI